MCRPIKDVRQVVNLLVEVKSIWSNARISGIERNTLLVSLAGGRMGLSRRATVTGAERLYHPPEDRRGMDLCPQ